MAHETKETDTLVRAVAVAARVSSPNDPIVSVAVEGVAPGSTVSLVDMSGLRLGSQATHDSPSPARLVSFLGREMHTSPFEMVDFTFHIQDCPLPVHVHWLRHRMGSFNVESARYKQPTLEPYVPTHWTRNATKNLQGSVPASFSIEESVRLATLMQESYDRAIEAYVALLEAGVSREQARMVLPQGMTTDFYWKANLLSLMNFLRRREAPNAQYETQAFARAVRRCVEHVSPDILARGMGVSVEDNQ